MGKGKPSYNEELLHWIWQKLHFDHQNLHTTSGEAVNIYHTGNYNRSDGPDFTNAEITVGGLRWYGDIEIHWKFSDWNNHGHSTDPNFNNVVLHVVFETTDKTLHRKDRSAIPTLCLSSFLSKPLQSFLDSYFSNPQLPCAGHFSFISEEAFARQIEKAHKEYFEQKVDDLLAFYNPSLPPSVAWKRILVTGLFDGLGIAHNRRSMQLLANELFGQVEKFSIASEFREYAVAASGIKSPHKTRFSWKHKGCRPGNHPLPRIQQAADCLWFVHNLPLEQWLHQKPESLWQNLTSSITASPGLGRERRDILFGTVLLPALYSLGNLFFSESLKSKSWSLWLAHRVSLPTSLIKLFNNSNLRPSLYNSTLGTIYQLRKYCRPKRCQNCKVFKNVISS